MKRRKHKLDALLVLRGLVPNLERARSLILAGDVTIDGTRADKAGAQFAEDAVVEVKQPEPFVSRGGVKLASALQQFSIQCRDRVCADVGAATGGFTDALLQAGAHKVYAVDVGYGDLHWKVRSDPRVVPIERTNARHLAALPEPIELAAIDVSFISLSAVLPSVRGWFSGSGEIVALVKPQFEALREEVPDGGVIIDAAVRERALEKVSAWCSSNGFRVEGRIDSPISGASGNREYFVFLKW